MSYMSVEEWRKKKGKQGTSQSSAAESTTKTSTTSEKTNYGSSGYMSVEEWRNKKKTGASTTTGYQSKSAEDGWNKYLADQKKKKEAEENKPWYEKLGEWLGQASDTTLPTATTTTVINNYRNDTSYREPTDKWSDSQRNEFGSLYNQSPTKAYEYAKKVNNSIAQAEDEKQTAAVKAKAISNPVGHTAGAILTAPLGLADYLDNLAEYNARGEVTENPGMTPFDYSQTVTSSIANDLNGVDMFGVAHNVLPEDIPVIGGKGWGDVYGIGTSIAQSALAGYAGGPTGTLVQFFGSAAAAGIEEAKQRGATDEQALKLGTLSGAAEGLAEMVGVDNLLKIGSASTMRQLMGNLVKQGAAEGIEEGLTTLMNNFADQIVMKDKSNFYNIVRQLMENGMSEEDAKKQAWKSMANDLAFDMVAGFASGSIHAGPQTAYQTVMENVYQPYQTGKAIMDSEGGVDALKQLANDVAGVSSADTHKAISDQIGKVDKKQSALQVGKLYNEVQSANNLANASANQADIAKSLERKGFTAQEAKAVSEALVAKYNGQELTKAQEKTLKSVKGNDAVKGVISNIMNNAKSTMGQRSDNIRTFNRDVNIGRLAKATGISVDEARKIAEGNLPTMKENGSESHYEVSADGKTIDREGNIVTIKGIASIKNGRMELETETGTVAASDVIYGSQGEALVYEAVSNLEGIIDTDTANKLSKHLLKLGDVSSDVYARGIVQAYTYGYYGYGREAMTGKHTLSANLTEKQRNVAYGLGEQYRDARTNAEQANARSATISKRETVDSKKATSPDGTEYKKVRFEGKVKKWGEKQKAEVEFIDFIASNFSGNTVHVFESYKTKDGKYVYEDSNGKIKAAPNGMYIDSTGDIYLDLNAGNHGEGLIMNTFAHELYHHIQKQSPVKARKLAEFLVQELGYESVEAAVQRQIAKAEKAGHGVAYFMESGMSRSAAERMVYDRAFNDFVADSLETMFTEGDAIGKLQKLKSQDEGLFNMIKNFIDKWVKKLREFYNSHSTISIEGDMVRQLDKFEQIQQMFVEALVDAGENFQSLMTMEENTDVVPVEEVTMYSYKSLAEAAGFEAVEEDGARAFTRNGAKVSEVTVEDIENSPIGALINYSLSKNDISEADAKRQKKMFADICTLACKTNDFSMTMQFMGSAVFTGMKANADKQYGTTYDFPSICTKTQAVIDAMSKRMVTLGRGLSSDELVKLYQDVFASGNPVPCPECYVFSRWIGIGGLLDNIKKYQDYYGDMAVEDVAKAYRSMREKVAAFAEEQGISFGKAKGALTSKLTKEYNKLTEKIEKAQNQGEKVKPADQKRLEELEPMMNTVKGMTWLENVYFADSSLKKVNPNFRVPDSVLFDLNNGEAFATQYKEAWAFRTTQGAGYGKAITPYAEARLGEGILVTNNTTNTIKGKAQGTLDNYFLRQNGTLDKKAREALDRARLKQKIQAFIGGQRFQSTSDARYENASDYLLAALEMQAMGGMVQVYTKVDGAVPALATWKYSINQSLMPLGGGLDANGNVKDTSVGGMNPKIAFRNREKHETAGTITIGVNDNHIRAMFKQWVRDFIIPYHASGGKADVVAAFRSIQEGQEKRGQMVRSTDYSRTQSDKILSDEVLRWQGKTEEEIQRIHAVRAARIAILTGGKPNMDVVRSNRFLSALYDKLNGGEWDKVKLAKSKVESQIYPNEFWDQTVSYENSGKITRDYLEYCDNLGFLHRFSGTVPSNGKLVPVNGYDQNGNRVQLTDLAYKYDENGQKTDQVEEFFWKVLTDRRMYDNQGQYLAQKVVTLNDTTTDTVTGFAKGNYGRQYDKELSMKIAAEIAGKQYSDRDNAPTFYSHMARVVDGVKQEKLGAASVVSMLRGKGVKAEEIKWSGIEDWLDGKKSVTKAELQEFIAGSMLQIEEETLSNEEIPYTEDQQKRIGEHTAKRDEIVKELAEVWKQITGEAFPIQNVGAGLESSVESKIRDVNLEHKKASFEGRLLEKLRKDLKEVIANNDDFGFDSGREALISIHRHRKSFIDHYELSTADKAVIVKYCNALNAYNELPNKINDLDTGRLRRIAHEAELYNRKIGDVRSEHYAENAKHMTKWGQYKIKGGENYREILFKIPGSSYYNDAMAMHWDERNGVLAHARIQDLNTFLGKMLFIEEIQSDWHNEGHKEGYRTATDKELEELEVQKKKLLAEKDAIMEEHEAFLTRYWEENLSEDEYTKEQESYFKKIREINAAGRKVIDKLNDLRLGVPNAPFRDNYHEYVLKRLIREAAENGYDSIGWTPAEIQVKRWSEEFAEGYRIEYDQDIPKFLNKYGKKWGTRAGKTVLDNGTEVWSMAITDSMKDSVLTEGQPLYSDRDSTVIEKPTDNKYIKMVEDGVTHIGEYDVVPKSKEPKKTILAWKALVVKPGAKNNPKDKGYGNMYPPQVHQVASTPYGVWLYANNAPMKLDKDGNPVLTKYGRPKVKEGMTYRPAWHFGDAPYASQFRSTHGFFDDNGVRRFYMSESKGILVWALCEMAADENYQDEADMAGHVGEDRIWDEQQASLWYLPENGYYKYMTNRVDPNSVTWYLSDKMRIVQTITDAEMREILTWIKEDGSTDLEFNYPLRLDGKDVDPADYGIPVGNVVGDGIDYVDRWKNQFREIALNGDIDITQSHFYYVPSTATNYGSYETVSFSKEVDDHSQELLKTKKDAKILTVNPGSTSAFTKSFEANTGVKVKEAKTLAGRKKIIEAAKGEGYDIVEFTRVGKTLGADVVIVNPDAVIRDYKFNNVSERYGRTDAVKYSDRDSESVSNRSLLANAFEGMAQNDIERNKIQEYRGKIDLINAEERKLQELNQKIKDLSFSKGPRDTKAIKDLQFEANQTANRISTYDKQLLRLEASKPLQDVLQREKKKAFKRAEKKGKEALEAYREKAAKTQRELLNKYQDARKKGIENREKTVMKHKIQNVVKELNDLLLNESKKRHVPDNLKKAVADALSLVNMDTVGAEERAAKYAALIAKETDPDKIDAYTVTMENILRQGDKMGQRLKELRDAYEEIQESDDPDIANAYDPVIAGNLKELSQTIGNTSLRNMTIEQLSDVYDMYKMVLTRVRDANKAMLKNINENISNLASRVIGEVRMTGGEHKYRAAFLDPVRKFLWNNLKPVYAMEHIGSATLTKVFDNVRAGEDTWAKDVTEAREYYLAQSKKYGYDTWDFDKKYRFQSASDLEFELTLEQMLSLYAYSKRDQAADHLRLGGFVFDSNIETYKEKGGKLKYKVNTADAHQITPEILAGIIGKLSDNQKAFVDEMQAYLSTTMGAKGNEVTMKMYGVKLFKEKFYFPLKSAKQFMFEQNEVSGEVKIKNSGFTNKTVAKANNPVILNNFMEVWSGHVNDMSMYHAFVLPLEDFNRVFNYNSPKKENQPSVSVKGTIQNAYSPAAVHYVKGLITDLNGGARGDSTTGIINKMMGLFKKGSVFASLSVVVQQPSAIARAAALVDTKYFIGPKVDHKRHNALWDEVKRYAPVAIIKEMGYFDTNMGKSTQDFILGKEYSGILQKMKALVTDSGYRDEVLSKAPALADEIAWCSIWEAVKREMHAKYPGLDVKGEPFLMLAGSRFTEVITKTQVYDSVLSRSANMRSKDTGMKMATAFMAEPTTSINMIADALLQGKRGKKKYARAAIGAVIASQIFNSILVSFVYAGRDDDEDKTYWEKYIGTLSGQTLDSLNPAGYIPFIKDIMSIVQGYDVERSDMAVISDLWKAWENLQKDNMSVYRKVEGFAGSIAQIFGLPVKNIMRDVRGIYQTVMSFQNGQQTTEAGIGYAVKSAIPAWMGGGDVSNQNQLYEAYLSGDKVQIGRVEGRYKDKNAINTALRKALRDNDPRIHEAAIAWNANDLDEYMRIAKQIIAEKHFSQDNVVMAIRAEANELAPDEDTATTSKAKGLFTAEKFAEAIAQGDQAMANAIKSDLIKTAQKNGKTAEDAEKSFNSTAKSDLREMFLAGKVSEQKAINALTTYCGMEESKALADVQYWAFKKDYPGVYADDSWFDKYYEDVADSGIGIDMYMEYRNQVKDITGDAKKERRMAVIDSLPITSAQKDAMYYAEGWTASRLHEAPWH